VSPYGYVFRSEDLIEGIKKNTNLKVFNVEIGGE